MPYVRQGRRDHLDPYLKPLIGRLWNPGDLSYIIARLAASKIRPDSGFAELGAIYMELEAAASEYYRVVMAPYEDKKRAENGDVYAIQGPGETESIPA